MADLQAQITELWARRDQLSPADADAFAVVRQAIDLLDSGEARVAEVRGDGVGDDEVTVDEAAAETRGVNPRGAAVICGRQQSERARRVGAAHDAS